MKILAIDDSNTMRVLIAKSLKELGHTDVTLCESGALAMNIMNNTTFDLVLLDWHMPGINGLEVLKFIKKGKFKDTPVIMLTSEQQKINIVRAIDNGAADYIIKPLNNRILREKINKICSQKEDNNEDSEKPELKELKDDTPIMPDEDIMQNFFDKEPPE